MVQEFWHTKEENFGSFIVATILVSMKLDGKGTSERTDLPLKILCT